MFFESLSLGTDSFIYLRAPVRFVTPHLSTEIPQRNKSPLIERARGLTKSGAHRSNHGVDPGRGPAQSAGAGIAGDWKGNEMGRSEFDAHASLASRKTHWQPAQAPRRRWPVSGAAMWLVAAVAALVALSVAGVL